MQTRLDRFDNSWYHPGAGAFVRLVWYFINAALFKGSWFLPVAPKLILLRLFGAKIGKGVVLKPGVNIKYPWKLEIGDYTWIGEGVWIDNLAEVKIGKHCCVSQGAMFLCGNHNYSLQGFDLMVGTIVMEDGAWAGAKTLLCPGTYMGSHAVLTAASVASGRLDPYTVYRGHPAISVKKREIKA